MMPTGRALAPFLAVVVHTLVVSPAQADASSSAVARIEALTDREILEYFVTLAEQTAVNCEAVARVDEMDALNQAVMTIVFDDLDVANDLRTGLEPNLVARSDQRDPVYVGELIRQYFSQVITGDEQTIYVLDDCDGFSS